MNPQHQSQEPARARGALSHDEPSPAELASWPADRALEWLFAHYASTLFNLGLRFCGDADEAEDLVQDVLLNAYRGWDEFDGRAKPSTWFYTIAARACQRRHRLRAGEPTTMDSLEDVLPARDGYVADPRCGVDDQFAEQVRRETSNAVESAIAALPLDFRMPLVLKDIAELSLAEVAQITGIPKATVKTRVHRARLKLRKELDRRLADRPAPLADREPEVCFDLLKAKLDALDQGMPEVAATLDSHLCGRCAAVFAGLDAVKDVCADIAMSPMPEETRARIARALEQSKRSASGPA